ncbi:HTH-type transcriptional regulator SgrR [Pseudaeromonas sharmana]|uniref:HTH-type transcriptional regulator SgrR n=1 Tax=Pseudaeromonas sharmana TaxID=328412 RepID=A0ABV8CJI0_9GAMM
MSGRLEHYYQKLLEQYGLEPAATTLQQLADLLFCSRRHVRSLLRSMEQAGWIHWLAESGRGRQSQLQCRLALDAFRRHQARHLLAEGKLQQAVATVGASAEEVSRFILSECGRVTEGERQLLRVPYYRPLPNLLPGLPLRRSEAHLVRQIFNGLTRVNEENGEVEADLAHHWQALTPLCWHFFLRPAVRFHDGRRLQADDVVASLQAASHLPLFAHLQQIRALSPRQIEINLSCEDGHLPWLLAQCEAMIQPASHLRQGLVSGRLPLGTGPYLVAENSSERLRLLAFDDYFGLRALLDEVDIWMWPALAQQLELGNRQVCGLEVSSGQEEGFDNQEMALEQGGYFLLYDPRSQQLASPQSRRWVQQQLAPWQLMAAVPAAFRRYWAPAYSLLPQWLHAAPDPEPSTLSAPGIQKLTLVYYEQQPEYALLAEQMAARLRQSGIELECQELDYASWWRGDGQADLWLGSVNFQAPAETGLAAWLLGTPLLRSVISGGDAATLASWQRQWQQGTLAPVTLMQEVMTLGWLQPLFHHWLRLQGTAQARGMRLNNLGWFDFKSVWLKP